VGQVVACGLEEVVVGRVDNMKPTYVFVVSSGCYSDYSIDAIFSTRAQAEEFIREAPKGDYEAVDINEWELDAEQYKKWRTMWICRLDAENGDVAEEHMSAHIEPCTSRTWPHFNQIRFRGNQSKLLPEERYIEAFGSSFVGAEHARKLAAEVRQAWLRAGKPMERYSWSLTKEEI